MVLPFSLPSIFSSCFDSDALSVTYSYNALFMRLCKIEVVLSGTGREKEFSRSVHPAPEWFLRLFCWKCDVCVCIGWKVGCASSSLSAFKSLFPSLGRISNSLHECLDFEVIWWWGGGLVLSFFCLRNFTQQLWRSLSLQDLGLINWHSFCKDFWPKTRWTLDLIWKILRLKN